MLNLGYFLADNQPMFKTTIQIEKLQERGHKIVPITEEEFMNYWNNENIG